MKAVLKSLLVACSFACLAPVGAQALRLNADSYTDAPSLPFAPPPCRGDCGPAAVPSGTEKAKAAGTDKPAALEANMLWEIRATDVRLDLVLERWAKTAGWRVQWDANRHVELAGPNTFKGAFRDVVGQVLSTPGIKFSEFPLEGCIYPNVPPLIRITRMGDQTSECPEEYK